MSSLPDPTLRPQPNGDSALPRRGAEWTRPCVACGQASAAKPVLGTRYRLCNACGSAHSIEPLEDCQDGYYFHAGHGSGAAQLNQALHDLARLGLAPSGPDGARLLVFGAGAAQCFELAAERGLEIVGFECSRAAVLQAQRQGLRSNLIWVARFDLLDGTSPTGSTRGIPGLLPPITPGDRLWLPDLLEHFEDPAELLAPSHRLLRPGGLLFGSTLATDGPLDEPQYHRQRFSSAGLANCLRRAGFELQQLWEQSAPKGPRLAFAARRD